MTLLGTTDASAGTALIGTARIAIGTLAAPPPSPRNKTKALVQLTY